MRTKEGKAQVPIHHLAVVTVEEAAQELCARLSSERQSVRAIPQIRRVAVVDVIGDYVLEITCREGHHNRRLPETRQEERAANH